MFQRINFGDGTGYLDSSGAPVNIHKKMSLNKTCVPPPQRSLPSYTPQVFSFLPASFSPVKLLRRSGLNSLPMGGLAKPDLCCTHVVNRRRALFARWRGLSRKLIRRENPVAASDRIGSWLRHEFSAGREDAGVYR